MPTPASGRTPDDVIRRALGDRYSLERELGRGGMGTVYLARDLRLDRPVALKVLLPEFAEQAGLRDRFLRETRTAASFSHPNIVPVYAVEESDELLAYAMGLVEGETLAERVARTGPLPPRDLVRVIQDVAYALAYAHGRGVVHRDIKPENVMLERATGRALVLNFGISRSMTAHAVPTAGLTRVGEVVGTPEYMSPEQASGDRVDGRSDLYSLGLVAWFAAVGRTAVTGENTQKILVRQLTEPVAAIETMRPDLPAALAAAIDRCVRKDPAERFATAEALVEEIDAAQLAIPEIPLPVRLFAGELSSLSMAIAAIVVLTWLMVRAQLQANMSELDTMLPAVALLAILVTRVLTTMSEGRRLAETGFTVSDITTGLRRVMDERVTRRAELRADPQTRRRRRATLAWGAVLLLAAVAMVRLGLATRVRLGPTRYSTPTVGIVLVFGGFALLGASLVMLLKSPFRMSPFERVYRIVWLGPVGRAFVRLSARGVRTSGSASASRRDAAAIAGTGAASAAARTREAERRGTSARPAESAHSAESAARRPDTIDMPDALGTLEARVAELERWRRARGD